MKSFCVFCLLMLFTFPLSAKTSWQESATKLSADPEIRKQGIEELKKIPNLNQLLRENFATDKNLVLAVIRNLNLHEFFPRLIESIENTKASELQHDVVTTATTVSLPADEKKLTSAYAKKMEQKDLQNATLAALLDGLAKFNYPISQKKLESLLTHPSYEIRTVSMLTASDLAKSDSNYYEVVKKAITLSPYQLRLEAYRIYSANAALAKTHKDSILKSCREEKNSDVKDLCTKVMAVLK